MNLKTHITLPALIIGSFITSAAWAGADGDHFPISISEVEAKAKARFEGIDTDESGSLNLAEFEASKPHHPAVGKHHFKREGKRHGKQGERPRGERRHPQAHKMRAAVQAEMFALMDADGNGVLSATEFESGSSAKLRQSARKRAAFKQLDKNSDSQLTPDEMPARMAHLRDADVDNDGLVTRDEFRAHRGARRGARQQAD